MNYDPAEILAAQEHFPACVESTVAQLHEVLQIAFGWEDSHLTGADMA